MHRNFDKLNDDFFKAADGEVDRLGCVFECENGRKIHCFDTVSSTNDVLRDIAFKGAGEGTVVCAKNQHSGRGRNGRSWLSPNGKGIYMSILFRPDTDLQKVPSLTLLCGLSVCEAIRKNGVDALIKWPNDVVINGKKLCGILAEANFCEKLNFVVVGIGINCDSVEFDEEIKDIATSMSLESGKETDKAKLLGDILSCIDENYDNFKKFGFKGICEKYKALSAVLGKCVNILGKEAYKALALDINEDGSLVVEKNGEKRTVFSGEVSLRF